MSALQIKLAIIPVEVIAAEASGSPLTLKLFASYEELFAEIDDGPDSPEREDYWAVRRSDIAGLRQVLLDHGLAARGEASEWGHEILRDPEWLSVVEMSDDFPVLKLHASGIDLMLIGKVLAFCKRIDARLVSAASGLVLENTLASFAQALPFEEAVELVEQRHVLGLDPSAPLQAIEQ